MVIVVRHQLVSHLLGQANAQHPDIRPAAVLIDKKGKVVRGPACIVFAGPNLDILYALGP